MPENKNANFEIIEAAFKQLGWNMTPVHSLREERERLEGLLAKERLLHPRSDGEWSNLMLRAEKAEEILKRIANEGYANPKDAIIRLARSAIEKNNDEPST